MNTKRISLRFNLDNDEDLKAWEYLQKQSCSKNRTIIKGIVNLFEQQKNIRDIIKKTINECLANISVVNAQPDTQAETISEDESDLLDSLDDFLCN